MAKAARPMVLLVNGLTAGRLVLAGVFPFAPGGWRVGLIVAAGFSDLADGWLSRRFGASSTSGQLLDPIADKAFMASVLLTLWYGGHVAAWQLPLVGFRDLAVTGGSAWQVARHGWGAAASLPPSRLGKLTTAAQFVFLLAALYHHGSARYACVAAAALSLSAGLGYLTRPTAPVTAHPVSCDSSAITSTRGSAGATGSTGSRGSST